MLLTDLGLRAATMLRRPHLEGAMDLIREVANGDGSHDSQGSH